MIPGEHSLTVFIPNGNTLFPVFFHKRKQEGKNIPCVAAEGNTRPAGTPFAQLVHQSPVAVRVEKGKMENIVFSSCQRVIGAYTPSTMTRKGGINKTRKAVAKRFKVTGTGKVLRRKQGKRHILQKKSSKRKRQLGKVALVDETQVWAVKQNLPFA